MPEVSNRDYPNSIALDSLLFHPLTLRTRTMSSLARGSQALRPPFRPHLSCTKPLHLRLVAYHHHHHQPFSTSTKPQAPKQPPSNQPPTQTTVTTPAAHEINAPTSTLPADLNLPDPLPTAKLKRLIALGRAYLAFYKTGLRNVFRNYRASLPLRKTLGLPAYIPISPPRRASSPTTTAAQPGLTMGRGQFQLVRRSARDVRRMIPFTLILIICGEFTPLVVPLVGSAITPATCRVPGQIVKERDAASKRKYEALLAHARAARRPSAVQVGSPEELALLAEMADPGWAVGASAEAVLRACAVFGLVKRHDRVGGSALTGLVYRPRLRRYVEYLAIDDGMIRAGGGVPALSPAEVRVALDERGAGDVAALRAGKKAEMVEREWLKRWLDVRGGQVQNQTGKQKIL